MQRRTLLLGAVGALIAGEAAANLELTPDDMVFGEAGAPVTLIQYASATCPHCAAFHIESWEMLKASILLGRVRLVFRELLTPPVQVAFGCFQLARLGGATGEDYMARLDVIFRQQHAMLSEANMAGVRDRLVALGAGFGFSEAQVMEAITSEAGAERINRVRSAAHALEVTGTPAFFINGERYRGAPHWADLSAALDDAAR